MSSANSVSSFASAPRFDSEYECPICMDNFEGSNSNNKVVTECGHAFHCSCLMTNISLNGFACPCCRTVMADEDNDEDEDSHGWQEEDNDAGYVEELVEITDDMLCSFRLFQQRTSGEELEEKELEEKELEEKELDELVTEELVTDELVIEEEIIHMADGTCIPGVAHIIKKMEEKCITYEDLFKCLLIGFIDYPEYRIYNDNRVERSFGIIHSIITKFKRDQTTVNNHL